MKRYFVSALLVLAVASTVWAQTGRQPRTNRASGGVNPVVRPS